MSQVGQTRSSDDVRVASALPLIATKQRTSHEVGSGPQADPCTAAILSLFDHLVGAAKQRKRYGKVEGFGGFRIDHQLDLGLIRGPADIVKGDVHVSTWLTY